MYKRLETYLEEISHFLSGRGEREEIVSEIRSHILEKAERESGPITEVSLDRVIVAYGRPRQVAEKYLDGLPIIAPAFKRHLFRYATLLFAIHLVFIVFAVIFKKSFIVFPFLFIPHLGIVEAVMYLPAAFLTDFGIVALVLYFITQSGKEFRLPWPKFALDLDEVKVSEAKTLVAKIATLIGAGIMLALTGLAVKLYIKYQTIIPLLMPEPGRQVSLIVICMLIAGTIGLFLKSFTLSRRLACWVDAVADSIALVLIGLLLRHSYADLFTVRISPALQAKIRFSLISILLFVALMIAVDLVANLIRLGRKRLAR